MHTTTEIFGCQTDFIIVSIFPMVCDWELRIINTLVGSVDAVRNHCSEHREGN